MPETIVITRPRVQAEPLAARLAASGRAAVVFPLLEIAPLADDAALRAALAQLDSFALAAFVSPNAIDAAFAHVKSWPARLPIAVLGEGSRAALARHGVACTVYSPPDPEHSDSEGLLSVLDLASLRGKRVLLVRGESGRELLADVLRAAGAEVVAVPAYRRSVP
ncbi:MAG TPA: uroporphyrinogen-III synthase, partial [Telluria sp.]|nr:uroporphyrinogen-III synthase [Telluria sp.]